MTNNIHNMDSEFIMHQARKQQRQDAWEKMGDACRRDPTMKWVRIMSDKIDDHTYLMKDMLCRMRNLEDLFKNLNNLEEVSKDDKKTLSGNG